ncbi:PIN/TRAM domain-containing protein [Candidatus Methylomirabilis sp.]|uniref:PIN/TRAM domain-containing protein n=1 Tax=Candidatus Methylomirabilis sp. TaxID=2032687 RepID=UPI003C717D37
MNTSRGGLPMIVGGAAIGFYLAFQAGAGPYQWLLGLAGLLLGASCGVAVMVLQRKFHQASLQVIVSGTIGFVLGLGLAELLFSSISSFLDFIPSYIAMTMRIIVTIGAAYLGAAIAIEKSRGFSMSHLVRLFREKEKPRGKSYKILDTSVIIDGRIADICETGFVEGTLLVPQFVLRELQQVADSSDPLKRNRGRRGLDILQKMQKQVDVHVEISDVDFPEIREVDAKLVALAKTCNAKVVTNDFNLNKVAGLQGIGVLNINELTNALRPVVLPGEEMQVYVLKEGKEYNQGIAYLDDGTMVVVDSGRRYIGQTVDVRVTTVLPTTAGRMIFSRLKEEAEAA